MFEWLGTTERLIIANLIFSVLTFIFFLLHSRRIITLFSWVLDYLQKTREKDCPKCNKPLLAHTIIEAREHGIMDKFTKEFKKQVESG